MTEGAILLETDIQEVTDILKTASENSIALREAGRRLLETLLDLLAQYSVALPPKEHVIRKSNSSIRLWRGKGNWVAERRLWVASGNRDEKWERTDYLTGSEAKLLIFVLKERVTKTASSNEERLVAAQRFSNALHQVPDL